MDGRRVDTHKTAAPLGLGLALTCDVHDHPSERTDKGGRLSSGRAFGRRLEGEFYARNALRVAPELLNKVLAIADGRAGRIVEVEAYRGADDPASHGYRGPTARTTVMFGPPGRLYVYLIYGMHWCANVVVETDGACAAVLLRALTPLTGLKSMRSARGSAAKRDSDLCNGPGKLTRALDIDGTCNGVDLLTSDRGITIFDDGTPPPQTPAISTRIGISKGADLAWRWYVPGVSSLSRP